MKATHATLLLLALAAIVSHASAAISDGTQELQAPRRALTGGKGWGYGGYSKGITVTPVVVPIYRPRPVIIAQPVVVSKGWGKGCCFGGYWKKHVSWGYGKGK